MKKDLRIYCIEGHWDYGNRQVEPSVEPMLKLLQGMDLWNYARRDCATIDEMIYFIDAEWARCNSGSILYVATHGKPGVVFLSEQHPVTVEPARAPSGGPMRRLPRPLRWLQGHGRTRVASQRFHGEDRCHGCLRLHRRSWLDERCRLRWSHSSSRPRRPRPGHGALVLPAHSAAQEHRLDRRQTVSAFTTSSRRLEETVSGLRIQDAYEARLGHMTSNPL